MSEKDKSSKSIAAQKDPRGYHTRCLMNASIQFQHTTSPSLFGLSLVGNQTNESSLHLAQNSYDISIAEVEQKGKKFMTPLTNISGRQGSMPKYREQ